MSNGWVLALRLCVAALVVSLAGLVWRTYRAAPSGQWAIASSFGLLGYLGAQTWGRDGGLASVWVLIAAANPALLWLLAKELFRDEDRTRKHRRTDVATACGVTLLSQVSAFQDFRGLGLSQQFATVLDNVMPQLVSVYLLGFAFFETQRGAQADLLEPRRQLRRFLVAVVAGYGVLILLFEIALGGARPPWQLEAAHLGTLATLMGSALYFVGRHGRLLFDFERPYLPLSVPTVETATAAPGVTAQRPLEDPTQSEPRQRDFPEPDAALRERLAQWEAASGFLEPGLTIGTMAKRLGTQEYLLRRLLNGSLGFRNFNDFLHRLRIAEACRRLEHNDAADLSVLKLSIDLGYSSLATFNRAFKAILGVTPTEFRSNCRFRNRGAKFRHR